MAKRAVAHFDCPSGISGDMVLGAQVDAGAGLASIEAELRKLKLAGWSIRAEKVRRGAVAATRVIVETHENHPHRGLRAILDIISSAAGLPPRVADRASRIFRRLGEAEAKVHGIPVEQVHFHEVGAVDAIVDIVGVAIGFELLAIDDFSCSALDTGSGQVKTAHGLLPVPAPATAELLRGAPVYSSGIQRELVTPTGAAIASTLASQFGHMPAMTLRATGYGAGAADVPEKPNVLRLLIGETAELEKGDWDKPVAIIETNVDDMSPQIYAYFAERVLQAGALDIFCVPAQMKKNRPGLLITILCEPELAQKLTEIAFAETTTIGVRAYEARRKCLARETVTVETGYGPVRLKVSRLNGSLRNAQPEYEDCQRIATEKAVPLKEVIAAASAAFSLRPAGRSRTAGS